MKENLHQLIERLPEVEIDAAEELLLQLCAKHDPILRAFLEAPEDDEPFTEEEEKLMEEAYEAIRRGDVVPAETIRSLYLKEDPCPGS